MRYTLCFIFFSFLSLAQNNNISVVSAEKVNVVYRGIANPIKIAVPGAKSFTATAPGLKVLDSIGNYTLSAGQGNEVTVKIEAVMQDGNVLKEEKVFRIKGLPAPTATLYGYDGYVILSKQALIDAVVEVEMRDFLFNVNLQAYSFTLHLPNKHKIKVEGNKMNEEAIKSIKKLKNNQEVIIDNIMWIKNPSPTTDYHRVAPIVVSINNKDR